MQVILIEDIPKLGIAGQVVKVRDGYARNYLLPQGKAALATEGRVRAIEHQKQVISRQQTKQIKGLEKVALDIHKARLEFGVRAGDGGKLFGSVTSHDIADQLAEKGIQVDRRKIDLAEPIKLLGEYKVSIRLHREVKAEVKVAVVQTGETVIEEPDEDETEGMDDGTRRDDDFE
jgi:large subunit ribosomal protein L9